MKKILSTQTGAEEGGLNVFFSGQNTVKSHLGCVSNDSNVFSWERHRGKKKFNLHLKIIKSLLGSSSSGRKRHKNTL